MTVLASAQIDGAARPLIWTFEQKKGRVFAAIPTHYTWTWEDPVMRALLMRGIAWAANEPLDRLMP